MNHLFSERYINQAAFHIKMHLANNFRSSLTQLSDEPHFSSTVSFKVREDLISQGERGITSKLVSHSVLVWWSVGHPVCQ